MRHPQLLAGVVILLALGCGDDTTTGGGGSGGAAGGQNAGGTGASDDGGGGSGGDGSSVSVRFPKSSIEAGELGVLVNDMDPQSVAVGAHYVKTRGIPAGNVITVSFPVTGSDNMPAAEFTALKGTIDAATPPHIQAYAVTWTTPTRVDCMSLTTALALGFSTTFCNTSGGGCGATAPSPYYASASFSPFTDLGMRPAMVLAGIDAASANTLTDRGLAADATFPSGRGFFLRTTDEARSVRWPDMLATVAEWEHEGGLDITYLDNSAGGGLDYIENEIDVLFYLTGLASVPAIETNTYRPGAVADHLTSYGGSVPTSGQMSILRWIEAGATASFGTLQEPCNYTQKFPKASVLLPHYFRGETVLEAYWKSVEWPGEGLFIGEPLAKPWGTKSATVEDGVLTIETTILEPNILYELRAADAEAGPYTAVLSDIMTDEHRLVTITLPDATAPFYELSRAE